MWACGSEGSGGHLSVAGEGSEGGPVIDSKYTEGLSIPQEGLLRFLFNTVFLSP